MRVRTKITGGFVLISLLVVAVGIIGFNASRRITESFKGVDEHLRVAVTAATEVSSYAERAEGHLMLYLTLHGDADRDKFIKRNESLNEQVDLLEKNVRSPKAKLIVESIKRSVEELLPRGEALIEAHDSALASGRRMDFRKQKELLLSFHNLASFIRSSGVQIAHIETDILNRQKDIAAATEISSYAKRAEGNLVLYLTLHDEINRRKFFSMHESLVERLRILDSRASGERELAVMDGLHSDVERLLRIGSALLNAFDSEITQSRNFDPLEHRELVVELNNTASLIRGKGVRLTKIFTESLQQERTSAIEVASAIQNHIITIVILAFIVALLMGYLISWTLTNPLMKLKNAVTAIDKEAHMPDIKIDTDDEIGDLAKSFRTMAESLRETTVSLDNVRNILDSMNEMVLVLSPVGAIETANSAVGKTLGYGEDELIGRPVGMIFGEEAKGASGIPGASKGREMSCFTKDGRAIPVIFSSTYLMDRDSRVRRILCVAQDITNRKETEDALKKLLDEKDMLIREIHHRVKNNIAIVSSLLNLQSGKYPEKEAMDIVRDGQRRLRAMSLIHEKFYMSEDSRRINARDYIHSLATEMLKAYSITSSKVKLTIDVMDIEMDVSIIVPVGLILNELITNAFKYAFPGTERGGEIYIGLSERESKYSLAVRDNGKGIPEGLDIYNVKSLGIQIVTSLVSQIRGELEITTTGGVEVTVTFSA